MREALIVGGANGIGLAIATLLAEDAEYGKIYIDDIEYVEFYGIQ